jgi:hypothetical protein
MNPKIVASLGAAIVLLALVPAAIATGSGSAPAAPTGLQTFLRMPSEQPRATADAVIPSYSRTPAFAWTPVRGANGYQFELSTSNGFTAQNALIWSAKTKAPAASVPLALPWITGEPASMYWRVRAVGPGGISSWSAPSAFNMRWTDKPQQLPSGPGYVRWTPVAGATGYQVWFIGAGKTISTITNVADEREYYLGVDLPSNVVHWRVRAERRLYGKPLNGLPAVSYGAWSETFTSANDDNPLDDKYARLTPRSAVSDVVSDPAAPRAHGLLPAVTVGGSPTSTLNLYRVYFFTDRDCVNRVFTGYPVASPAYVPRVVGGETDALPAGKHAMADGELVTPTELPEQASSGTGQSSSNEGNSGKAAGVVDFGKRAKVDLWDSNWPHGRYVAVAVPVEPVMLKSAGLVYQDVELPQDVCAQGRFLTFGKESRTPALSAGGAPTATGLSPTGRLVAAATATPKFYGSPLVTWDPAGGAVRYDVQWSHTKYPWRAAGSMRTPATSAVLPLAPGTWWYRVRGINDALPGNQMMSWSSDASVVITRPSFSVLRG